MPLVILKVFHGLEPLIPSLHGSWFLRLQRNWKPALGPLDCASVVLMHRIQTCTLTPKRTHKDTLKCDLIWYPKEHIANKYMKRCLSSLIIKCKLRQH